MKEEFVCYVWKNKLLDSQKLVTTDGEHLEILHPGTENTDAGPDFFAARIKLGNTIWVGNVEIHVKSSDWLNHKHHNNEQYSNVVLHVVHENDIDVKDTSDKKIKVLEIKNVYNPDLLRNYEGLMRSRSWIPCQNQIGQVDEFIIRNWLNRLLVERLERKSEEVKHFLEYFKNDWEQTFFFFLSRNFGFKVNTAPFGILAQRTPHLLLQKNNDSLTKLEAILFGQAGLLLSNYPGVYPRVLFKEYQYQQKKFGLQPLERGLWKFARIRPVNFPTIRLSQLASILHGSSHLFRNIVEVSKIEKIHKFFAVNASEFWETHYTFERASPKRTKNLGKQSIDNIIINTIAPVLFIYGKLNLKDECCEKALYFLNETQPESNSIIKKWQSIGIEPINSVDTQALLELKKFYCTPKKCLNCTVGNKILRP